MNIWDACMQFDYIDRLKKDEVIMAEPCYKPKILER